MTSYEEMFSKIQKELLNKKAKISDLQAENSELEKKIKLDELERRKRQTPTVNILDDEPNLKRRSSSRKEPRKSNAPNR